MKLNKKTKGIFGIVLVLVMIFTMSGTPAFAATSDSSENISFDVKKASLKGIAYPNGELVAVNRSSQMAATLTLDKLDVIGNCVDLVATIKHKDIEHKVATKGDMYKSVSDYLTNSITVFFGTIEEQSVDRYVILSFTIENSAEKSMLLPANSSKGGQSVIKLAVADMLTNTIYYFEDDTPTAISYALLNSNAGLVNNNNINDVRESENWFIPFISNVTNQEENVEIAKQMLHNLDLIEENDLLTASELRGTTMDSPTSPIPGVSGDVFMILGNYYYTDTSTGYQRKTSNYPIGTGNMITEIIRWGVTVNAPTGNGNDASAQLAVTQIGTFLYRSATNDIIRIDNSAYLRIQGDPSISMSILTKNSDIVTRVRKTEQSSAVNSSIDLKSYLGLLPYGDTLSTAVDILTSVSFDTSSSDTIIYPSSHSEAVRQYGNAIRGAKAQIEGAYLRTVNDRITLETQIRKPTDALSTYPSSRTIGYVYKFSVYTRDGFGLWTDNMKDFEQTRSVLYSW